MFCNSQAEHLYGKGHHAILEGQEYTMHPEGGGHTPPCYNISILDRECFFFNFFMAT